MIRSSARCALLLTALSVSMATGSAAKEIEGVRFADSYRTRNVTMPLSCVGLLRFKIFIKGYVGALYLGEGVDARAVLSDVPRRLELSYFHAIAGKDFAAATAQGMEANVGGEALARLRPQLDRLNALYKDVQPGDRYALTYVPGVGTELALNGQPLGTVEGAEFGSAVFAIWLGPKPLDESLKSQLLTCR